MDFDLMIKREKLFAFFIKMFIVFGIAHSGFSFLTYVGISNFVASFNFICLSWNIWLYRVIIITEKEKINDLQNLANMQHLFTFRHKQKEESRKFDWKKYGF